jgi:hypothetical protein
MRNGLKRPRAVTGAALSGLLLWAISGPMAASGNGVSVDDSAIGATTRYTVSFKAAEPIDSTDALPDSIVFASNGGADLSAATFVGLSGGSALTASFFSSNSDSIRVDVTGGTAAVGDLVTLEFANVVNPGVVGPGPDFTLRQVNFVTIPPIIVNLTLPAVTYTSTNAPVVVNPIDDLTGEANGLVEGDPAFEASSDLKAVFDDADMDPLTFSLDPGTNPAVLTASITGDDRLLLTPVGSGRTTVAVRATAVDGSAVDSFEVQVIGLIDNAVMTPSDTMVGRTATYELTFDAAGALSAGQNILVSTGLGGPDYSSASLTLSGGSLTGSLPTPTDQGFRVSIDGGSAPAGAPIAITLDNVVNPTSAGLGPPYSIRVVDGSFQLVDRGTASGNVFEAGGAPFVVSPILNQFLNEADGPAEVVADIGTVFDEADGDPITYEVLAGTDPLIATAELIDGALIVTPVGPGITTVAVRASDIDGSITDSFGVEVVGIMDDAAFGPLNNATDALTSYVFSFTTSSALSDGFLIFLNNAGSGGPDYSQAQLLDFEGGDLAMTLQSSTGNGITMELTGGSASIGTPISFTLGSVRNPSAGGTGPAYASSLLRLQGGLVLESAEIAGSDFVAPVDPVFDDRFEAIELR